MHQTICSAKHIGRTSIWAALGADEEHGTERGRPYRVIVSILVRAVWRFPYAWKRPGAKQT